MASERDANHLFGMHRAPGRAAGRLQGLCFMYFCNSLCVLAGSPLDSDGPMVWDLCNWAKQKVSYQTYRKRKFSYVFLSIIRPSRPYKALKGLLRPSRSLYGPSKPYKALKGLSTCLLLHPASDKQAWLWPLPFKDLLKAFKRVFCSPFKGLLNATWRRAVHWKKAFRWPSKCILKVPVSGLGPGTGPCHGPDSRPGLARCTPGMRPSSRARNCLPQASSTSRRLRQVFLVCWETEWKNLKHPNITKLRKWTIQEMKVTNMTISVGFGWFSLPSCVVEFVWAMNKGFLGCSGKATRDLVTP